MATDRFNWIERPGREFPFFNDQPARITGPQWLLVMAMVVAGLLAVALPIHWPLGPVGRLVPALLIFILVWFVLRPVMKNIANPNKAGAGSGGDVDLGDMGGLDGELSADRVSLGGPQSILLPSPSEGYDAQLNAIKSLVAEDPGRVAQVVKEWINADE